ncbi:AAA family ATPase [Kitasatospora sp. NPDC008050]|uniref:AAA family ATPase n=1 Tax=Kitasatospora sp. NPDC008050 TaxID=3364021 RepID=UPI0036ED202B
MTDRQDASAEPTDSRNVAHAGAPRWAASLRWELRRGRQVIITGQVRDRWWWQGEPASFRTVLAKVLDACGADVVAWWEPVDGVGFPLAGHRERFEALARRAGKRPPQGHDAEPPPQPDHGQDRTQGQDQGQDRGQNRAWDQGQDRDWNQEQEQEQHRNPGPGPGQDPHQPPTPRDERQQRILGDLLTARPARRLVPVEDALAEAHRLTAFPQAATAFVFEDIDLALPQAEAASVQGYLRLRAAMADAATPPPGPGRGEPPLARNPVLAVVGDLGRLPGWLHREDPRTVVLHVDRPDQAERRRWFAMTAPEFNGGANATAAELEALVGATDGMTAWELDALARTSQVRKVPVQEPGKLLERHRLNVNVDPWTQLDRRTIAAAAQELGIRVLGQPGAVDAVVGALQAAYVGVGFGSSGAARPRGSFFFVGPTGVGKTELAKAVAQLIFGDPSAYARFDMSEYQQEHAAERLAGAPPGFLGYDQGGELTRRVQERPFSVLLFDEIEKAHPAVLDKFLQILEDGRLTDGQGRTAYFSQSLIIFTSNTGSDGLHQLLAEHGGDLPYPVLQEHFTEAVEAKFRAIGRPEIYGRLKPGVVVFDMLRTEHVIGIAERLLGQLAESVRARHQVELVHDRAGLHPWITTRMADPERQAYGGRQIRNELEAVLLAVVRHLVTHQPPAGSRIRLGIAEDGTVRVTPDALVKKRDGED